MARSRPKIITARGQLVVNVTEIQKPGVGTVTITGSSGSITSVTVDSVTITGGAVAYDTSAAVTATALAANINAFTSSPNYYAFAVGAVVTIYQQTPLAGTLAVAVNGSLSATTANLTGGQVGDGDSLGYTDAGVVIEWNDGYLEETAEETGQEVAAIFYMSGSPIIRSVLKQFDPDVLAARFPAQYVAASQVVQWPGSNVDPGDDWTTNNIVLEFRPDDVRKPSVLARSAAIINPDNSDMTLRTTEVTKTAVAFRCMTDSEADAATGVLQVGFAGNFTA